MKRNITTLFPLLVLLSATGCSDKVTPEERVVEPLYLYAAGDGLSASTKAETGSIVPFGTTIFASTQSGVYTTLNAPDEWRKAATVEESGSVSFTETPQPSYPETGGWIYLVAVAPQVEVADVHTDAGTVTYTLGDTPQDLLYAKEIRGSRWDNQRFSGNTVAANDKPLVYGHLLTQLTFKAKKAATGGLPVTVDKITLNGVKTSVTVTLADGATTFADGSATTLNLVPIHNGSESGSETINSSTDPVSLGTLLVPPLNQTKADGSSTYTITVETSIGTFGEVPLTFPNEATDLFQPGVSHEITLTISDTSLGITSVKVAGWTTVDKGQLEL